MKKLFTLVFVALLVSLLGAGIKKTLYRDYGIVVFHPDSLISVRAHQIVWGNFWVIQSDSTDTMSMTPDKIIIDSVIINDYLYSTDDVRFDSTLYFTDGGADTSSIVQDGTNLKFASDNPFAMSRQLTFTEDVDRTGEGTILFANAIPIGMTTPGDCQGMKTEFKYGVSPTLTGGGKVIQGLMLKMTMDQRWKFASANRNADVRAIGVQAELNDSLGGVLSAIYANAYTDIATNKQIIGEHTTGAYGVGMCAIEARTEIKGAGALTVPHIAGLYVLHRRMGTGGVTGDYHAIHIENSQGTGAISGTETAIHFEPNTMAPPGANFDYGMDMEPVAFGTADHRLSSGATLRNPDDDTLIITEAITQFDGGEVLIDNGNLVVADGQKIVVTDGTEVDSFEIYDDGTNSYFASDNPFAMNNDLYTLAGKKHYFVDATGADTNEIYNSASYLIFDGDNAFWFDEPSRFNNSIIGEADAYNIIWDGAILYLDYDNNQQLAYISFHSEDTIKVDTTGATGHRLSWTGAGGMEIRDGTGADSARWYDDGTSTIFTTDNDFVLSDDVTLGDTINTVFLPKATRLILADSSGADSTILFNNGTQLSITSDNKIVLGNQNVYINPGDTLFIASAALTEFSIYASGTDLYIKGTGADDIYLQAGDIRVVGNLIVDDGNLIVADGQHVIITDGAETDSIDIYDNGTVAYFESDNPLWFSNNIWIPGDTLFFTDGGADTSFIVNDGTYLRIDGDIGIYLNKATYIGGNLEGTTESRITWDGWEWKIDADNDDELAYISFHAEDSIKVDTSLHIMEWTGSGGIQSDGGIHGDIINDQFAYQCAGDIFNIASNSVLILGWISPATTEQDLSPHNHDATYQGTMTTGDQLAKGLVWKLDFDATDDYLSIVDHTDFTFDDAASANGFTMGGWVEVVATASKQTMLSKWDETVNGDPELREWVLYIDTDETLVMTIYDESEDAIPFTTSDDPISAGWHLILAVYDGAGGSAAANGITFYVDGVVEASTPTNDITYVGMENLAVPPFVGAIEGTGGTNTDFWQGDMGHMFITTDQLDADQNWELYLRTRGYYNE